MANVGPSHRLTGHRPPATERFDRNLAEDWAYAQVYTSGQQRADALPEFMHHYNHYRAHTALGGQPAISRVDNVSGRHP
ncbi:integrase core domain-containing protein [Lentzea alba]|uniref:integrase core domain-containing protein n=1 Tax=Lentzea alba TaxID=2714351 RepID=UPI0039BFD16F